MSTQSHTQSLPNFCERWTGSPGIFVPLFIAACYVQWEKVSKGRGLNRLMASATAFFGLTVTTVSGKRQPQHLTQKLTQ